MTIRSLVACAFVCILLTKQYNCLAVYNTIPFAALQLPLCPSDRNILLPLNSLIKQRESPDSNPFSNNITIS